MVAHAKLSASGAHRWMACPGSVKAEEGLPDRSSSFAEEGTKAHELMEQALKHGKAVRDLIDDMEMSDYVQIYVDYVLSQKKPGDALFIERRVDFSEWVPEGFGTADTIIVSDEVLHIVDLKYGKGVPVFAENNPQALLYALGAYDDFMFLSDFQSVKISIVQPRRDVISEWEISITDLLKFGETVRQAALDTQNPKAKRVPGEKQCRFCKAKATCPALYKLTSDTLLADFEQIDEAPAPHKLTFAQLRKALENKSLIEAWLLSVENSVKELLLEGATFEGFKLVEGRSIRKWSDEESAASRLVQLVGEQVAYTKKLISPAQAEKALGKKDKAKIEDMIVKPRGAATVAKETDPRPAISPLEAEFEALDGDENEA
jgi:hypothetical protein